MAYNNLGDRQRARAILPFLEAAGTIDGLVATAVVDKRIGGLVTGRNTLASFGEELGMRGCWGIHEFENMARTAHFVSLFLAGVVRPSQNMIWISDQDQIMGNQDRMAECANLASRFSSVYIPFQLGDLHIGTTDLDEGDRFEEDLASIPDLVAGSLADVVTGLSTVRGWFLAPYLTTAKAKRKSDTVVQ